MRASWTDVNGRKVSIANVHEIVELWDKIEFKSNIGSTTMRLYIDDEEFIEGHNFREFCSCIDTEIILSADKE